MEIDSRSAIPAISEYDKIMNLPNIKSVQTENKLKSYNETMTCKMGMLRNVDVEANNFSVMRFI